jgi:hypothetical protein
MDMAELKAIVQDITRQAGAPKHSDTPRGGDLFIYPSDLTQQQAFLQLSSAANRSLSASLPKSSTGKKGIIHNVPLSESEEDLLDSLLLQGAIKVERFHRSIDGSTTAPTGTVCITFDSPPPSRVTIVALSFTVSTYYPSPYKCSKCWKLGHTKNHCTSSDIKCRKCGDAHDESMLCSQKCVNCSSPDHLSDSKTCPAFLDLSALIKFSIDNDISIKEARSQIGKTYSAVTSRHPTSPTPMEIPQGELTRLKTDIRNLQEELAALKRDTITPIEEKVNKISADTDSTNKRLDKLEESITGRFDELVNLITTRLPPITADHPAVPADDVMESTPASIKRAAQPASQIITRRNYASPSHSRTSTTADSAKKTKTNNA